MPHPLTEISFIYIHRKKCPLKYTPANAAHAFAAKRNGDQRKRKLSTKRERNGKEKKERDSCPRRTNFPPSAHAISQIPQGVGGRVPVDAGVGDADAALEPRETGAGDFLVAGAEIGFDHDANNPLLSGAELVDDVVGHQWLVIVVLERVACDGC